MKQTQVDTEVIEVEVSATDSTGATAYNTFEVTVKDRNTSPTFAHGLTGVSYTVPENSSAGTAVGGPLTVTDADAGDKLSVDIERIELLQRVRRDGPGGRGGRRGGRPGRPDTRGDRAGNAEL